MNDAHRNTPVLKIAFIGNALPRRCGIATFTTDLQQAIAGAPAAPRTLIVAMTDAGATYDYPPVVELEIRADCAADYRDAADALNARDVDVVCLQHEFGIFGGEQGAYVIELVSRLKKPLVTTLHTVLCEPTPMQRDVFDRVVDASARVVVMAEKGRDILRRVYGVPAQKIDVVPHGIPDVSFVEPDAAKVRLGLEGRSVVLTFGLLSPNKGIEFMIDAMPQILKARPDAVYVVLGATHPNLVRHEGEAYREHLQARVRALGICDSVFFLNRFVDQPTLLEYISSCDVYVTPYLDRAQMTSGTLAYSFGLGKAVVSTPYWHAEELLADGRGVIVPASDSKALGDAVGDLLTDEPCRRRMRTRAYATSRSMTWERTAARYLTILAHAASAHDVSTIPGRGTEIALPRRRAALPYVRLDHFLAMCDDTGLFQHAVHSLPDRSHGYCVDDNARALLLACMIGESGEADCPDILQSRFAAFVQHAWNPDNRRFRNFMSFDRRWLEERGSEDSHGRVLWALGACAADDSALSRRRWAAALFWEALPSVDDFRSPRAWAFALLGLAAIADADGAHERDDGTRRRRMLADRLISLLEKAERPDWRWFEAGLAYDNARLCQALILTGAALGESRYTKAGLRTLRWLMLLQRAPAGHFRPVGSDSFGDERRPPRAFDQQPLEAAACIAACLAASDVDGDPFWTAEAHRAFGWFVGRNDLSTRLVDVETGSCRDGLHRDRANENRGGESVVSYLLSLTQLRMDARLAEDPVGQRTVRALS